MPELDERLGREVQLSIDGSVIGDVVSAELSVEGSTVDVINDDTGEWTEKLLARKSWSLSLTVHNTEHVTDTNQAAIATALFDATGSVEIELAPKNATTGDITLTGEALVTSYNYSKSTDDVMELSYEFEGNGELTRNTQSA